MRNKQIGTWYNCKTWFICGTQFCCSSRKGEKWQSWVLATRCWILKIISPTTSCQHKERHINVAIHCLGVISCQNIHVNISSISSLTYKPQNTPSLEILMCFIPHKEKLMKTSKILPDDSRLKNEYVGVCKWATAGQSYSHSATRFQAVLILYSCSYWWRLHKFLRRILDEKSTPLTA